MKYRNLRLCFTLEDVSFNVLSIGLEKFLTPIPGHSHSKNSYEFHYISYGQGTLIAEGKEYRILPGTFFMTGPGVMHEQISDPGLPMTEYGVYLQVKLPTGGVSGPIVKDFLRHCFWIGEAHPALHELMKQLLSELELCQDGYELMLTSLLEQLILLVTRQYRRSEISQSAGTLPPPAVRTDNLTYLIIEEAFLYNYRDLTLEDLAAQLHLGVRQTQRLLKKHYNQTFMQKKTEARMAAACLLLQDKNRSVSTISWELGYSSPEHFSNSFKQYYHLTPAAYRRL